MTTPSAVSASSNSTQQDYPAEEWRIVGALIRQIGSAPTWAGVVEASDALFHVQLMAKSMRDERDHHTKTELVRAQ